ncbi:triphosphoribosyl-dephospho-CoA synthase [Ancylomarina longa]|uniref:Triphosphoribosyl-dephospho-CoA synthase n=1 Tax=Ancylomarina longa TaxID=2487017 RepID=A0A434AYL9_9BACT|nr:triphosphoribosyl-dephospho-CoA synthase [Ancylomarina longa]RUT79584.1 hypothetical protein DLK05_02515 [Ancylomarina longa]
MDTVLQNILEAKEQRAKARQKFADQGNASLSFSLNIPGYPKSNSLFKHFFDSCLNDLKIFLLSYRINICEEEEINHEDCAGEFYLTPVLLEGNEATDIKRITEIFEEEHPLGRLIDVDITDQKGNPVSSGKAKACYYCNSHPAVYCMRNQAHDLNELRQKISKDINLYWKEKEKERISKDIAAEGLKALLHEVALTPKPGLVDRVSNGSHTDMDFGTFLNSSAVLSVYFKEIVDFGYTFSGEHLSDALPKLRQVGIRMEQDMFIETNGVNTHKGAIFLLGFSLFISAYLIAQGNFSYQKFVEIIKDLNGNLVDRELVRRMYPNQKTHGEECFDKFGEKGKGIRGEIQDGLPTVFKYALPVLRGSFDKVEVLTDKILQKGLTLALLSIMANNDDSNILYRKGENILEELKEKSHQAYITREIRFFELKYQELIEYCQVNHISPGGSADLLAVSLFLYKINRRYGKS